MNAKKNSNGFGAQAVAEALNNVDAETRERLLLQLAKTDPEAWAQVQDKMFTFEDLAKLDDEILRSLVAKVPQAKWAVAMRKVSSEFRAAIFRNMSKIGREALAQAIEDIGPQRLSFVEATQKEIVEFAKTMGK